MEIAQDQATSLEIRRVFKAPVATVYAAWTDPEQMKRWMAPSDAYQSTVTAEVKVGGRYRIVMNAPDGQVHRLGGVYREVVPNRRLVYTWAWESTPERESLVNVEFRAVGDATELVLTHHRFADTEARDRHLQGWNGCIARLERLLG